MKDKELLHILRQDVPCKIILYLFCNLICSQVELSKELNKRPATIKFHLRKLIDMDIIAPVKIEKGLICRRPNSSLISGRNPVKSEVIYGIKSNDICLNILT